MAKVTFKEYNQGQGVLFPMNIDSKIPKDSPVRLVNRIVDELDLTDIDLHCTCQSVACSLNTREYKSIE